MASKDKGQKPKENQMKTYVQIIKNIQSNKQIDPSYVFRMKIALSVYENIIVSGMTCGQIDDLCEYIYNALINRKDNWPDIDEITYRIYYLLKDGKYKEPDEDCVQQAIDDCNA